MKRIFADNYKVTQNYHSGHGGMDIVGLSSKNIISPQGDAELPQRARGYGHRRAE